MLKIGICDDDIKYTDFLVEQVSTYFSTNSLEYKCITFNSGEALLNYKEDNFDILLLDIEINELNGMNLAQTIRSYNQDVIIIFITSFINYSLEGYKVNAFRYILKDSKAFQSNLKECLDSAIIKLSSINDDTKVAYTFKEGIYTFNISDLIYIESSLHTLKFHFNNTNSSYSLRATLNKMEQELNTTLLLRIHQSYLVNMKHIKCIDSHTVILDNNLSLPISKNKYKNSIDRYLAYRVMN